MSDKDIITSNKIKNIIIGIHNGDSSSLSKNMKNIIVGIHIGENSSISKNNFSSINDVKNKIGIDTKIEIANLKANSDKTN